MAISSGAIFDWGVIYALDFILILLSINMFGGVANPRNLYFFVMILNLGYAFFMFPRHLRTSSKPRDWKDEFEITNPNKKEGQDEDRYKLY
jgi:hypothetical protein